MRRYTLITGLLSVSLGAAAGLAACGGDSAPETPIVVTDQATTLTKSEFITQSDAICDQANSEITTIAAAGEGITRAADVADLRQGVITDVRALGTPVDDGTGAASSPSTADPTSTVATTPDTSTFPGDSTTESTSTDASSTDTTSSDAVAPTGTGNDLEDFLAAMALEVKAGEKIDLANQRGEDTAAAEGELVSAKEQAATAATAYGFEVCGTDGGSSTASGTSSTSSATESSSSSGAVAPSTGTVTPSEPSTGTSGGSSDTAPTDDGTSGSGSSGGVGSTGGGVGPG